MHEFRQAVSGLVNCDMAYTAGLPTGTNQHAGY